MIGTRERRNPTERAFEALARANGWQPVKRGWPDFLCFRPDGPAIAVEVKPRMRSTEGMKSLTRDQVATMDFLAGHGIDCYVSDGQVLEKFDGSRHRRKEAPAW